VLCRPNVIIKMAEGPAISKEPWLSVERSKLPNQSVENWNVLVDAAANFAAYYMAYVSTALLQYYSS
jgi:hypothetical protein